MKPSSVFALEDSLDRPMVKPTIHPAFLTLVGFRTPPVIDWTAVVRVRTMRHCEAETPEGQEGAMIGLPADWPSSTTWADATPGAMRARAHRPAAIAKEERFMSLRVNTTGGRQLRADGNPAQIGSTPPPAGPGPEWPRRGWR